jgi:hypothetical protein
MSTIRFHEATTSTPEQYIAALTDFGPGRSKIFGNIEARNGPAQGASGGGTAQAGSRP